MAKKKENAAPAKKRVVKNNEGGIKANTRTSKTAPPLKAPLLGKVYRVTTPKQAKKLLSALIIAFQKGEVNSRFAKDLCYFLSVFLTVFRDSDFETRIKALESKK